MKNLEYKDLLILIDKYIEELLSYNEFEEKFYIFFEKEIPIKSEYQEFVWEIEDRVAFSAENPNQEDRSYGYINTNEFRKWLSDYKKTHIKLWNKESNL